VPEDVHFYGEHCLLCQPRESSSEAEVGVAGLADLCGLQNHSRLFSYVMRNYNTATHW